MWKKLTNLLVSTVLPSYHEENEHSCTSGCILDGTECDITVIKEA